MTRTKAINDKPLAEDVYLMVTLGTGPMVLARCRMYDFGTQGGLLWKSIVQSLNAVAHSYGILAKEVRIQDRLGDGASTKAKKAFAGTERWFLEFALWDYDYRRSRFVKLRNPLNPKKVKRGSKGPKLKVPEVRYSENQLDLMRKDINDIVAYDLYRRVAAYLWDKGVRCDDCVKPDGHMLVTTALNRSGKKHAAVPSPYVTSACDYLKTWEKLGDRPRGIPTK